MQLSTVTLDGLGKNLLDTGYTPVVEDFEEVIPGSAPFEVSGTITRTGADKTSNLIGRIIVVAVIGFVIFSGATRD